jgi:hypothetical protein
MARNNSGTRPDIAAIEAEMNGCSPQRTEFLTKMRDRSTARFLAACRSLAVVRKMALPALQVRVDVSTRGAPERAVEPENPPIPRLRLGG